MRSTLQTSPKLLQILSELLVAPSVNPCLPARHILVWEQFLARHLGEHSTLPIDANDALSPSNLEMANRRCNNIPRIPQMDDRVRPILIGDRLHIDKREICILERLNERFFCLLLPLGCLRV